MASHRGECDRRPRVPRRPTGPRGHSLLAWAFHRTGETTAAALEEVEAAQASGVRSARILFHAGAIRVATGDVDGGRRALVMPWPSAPHSIPGNAPRRRACSAARIPAPIRPDRERHAGRSFADYLRLNTAIPPCKDDTATDNLGKCRAIGVFFNGTDAAADLAAFPNGRRLEDDVTDIEIRAVAQGYGPNMNSLFSLPNLSPNNIVGDGVDKNADMPLQSSFPYIGLPHGGYEHVHHNQHL